jgi:hypothetical protein
LNETALFAKNIESPPSACTRTAAAAGIGRAAAASAVTLAA